MEVYCRTCSGVVGRFRQRDTYYNPCRRSYKPRTVQPLKFREILFRHTRTRVRQQDLPPPVATESFAHVYMSVCLCLCVYNIRNITYYYYYTCKDTIAT